MAVLVTGGGGFVGLNLVQAEQRVSISDFRRKTGGGD